MKKLIALSCIYISSYSFSQTKNKSVTITIDSVHLYQFLQIWQLGYSNVWDANIMAPVAKEWYRYGDSLFSANAVIYNSWIPKPVPPKKDSSSVKPK